MTEEDGKYNFDIKSPPINPLDQRPIDSWYRSGQTWNGIFGDIAPTVEECRAELVGAYLMDDAELLALFGYTSESDTLRKTSHTLCISCSESKVWRVCRITILKMENGVKLIAELTLLC